MKKGILVINNFYGGAKMEEIVSFLSESALKNEIELEVRKSGELLHNCESLSKLSCDFVLFWDKDVVLAKMLENAGIRVFNSSKAIENCDNKALTYIELVKNGIRTPKTIAAPLTFEGVGYNNRDFVNDAVKELGLPVVVKEFYGSFGQQVYLAGSIEELNELIDRFGCKGFLFQEYISASHGTDIRINVVGGKVISCMQRYSVTGDFRSNISNGGLMKDCIITRRQEEAAIEACKALELDFAGVDVLTDENNEPLICEVNSNPHFKSSIDCTGIDVSYYIMKYIQEEISKGYVS